MKNALPLGMRSGLGKVGFEGRCNLQLLCVGDLLAPTGLRTPGHSLGLSLGKPNRVRGPWGCGAGPGETHAGGGRVDSGGPGSQRAWGRAAGGLGGGAGRRGGGVSGLVPGVEGCTPCPFPIRIRYPSPGRVCARARALGWLRGALCAVARRGAEAVDSRGRGGRAGREERAAPRASPAAAAPAPGRPGQR